MIQVKDLQPGQLYRFKFNGEKKTTCVVVANPRKKGKVWTVPLWDVYSYATRQISSKDKVDIYEIKRKET